MTSSSTDSPNNAEAKPAALWKRLFATIYDVMILVALSLLYGALVTLISTVVLGNSAENYRPNASGLFVQIGWVISVLGFYCFFWLRVGQTVAMKAWRLKLVTNSGHPLDLSTCALRGVLGFASFACFGLGYFWQIFDPQKLAFHDRLTKTKVIQLSKEEA